MTPLEYEKAVARALGSLGWEANVTPGTGDFGADVVAHCAGETLVVQCKMYGSANYVGFGAIKEASFALKHFNASLAAVIFTGRISKQARLAAEQHDILLLTLRELETGCILDRTERGRRHRERLEIERDAEARRTEKVRALGEAKSIVMIEEAWRKYYAARPEWLKRRRRWLGELGVALLITASILWTLIASDAGLVFIGLSILGMWFFFANFVSKVPTYQRADEGASIPKRIGESTTIP